MTVHSSTIIRTPAKPKDIRSWKFALKLILFICWLPLKIVYSGHIHTLEFWVFGNKQRPTNLKTDIFTWIHIYSYTLNVISEIYLYRSTASGIILQKSAINKIKKFFFKNTFLGVYITLRKNLISLNRVQKLLINTRKV